MWRLLMRGGYQDLTLEELVNRYAPASDNNDTQAYMAAITRATGLGPSTRVSELTETTMNALVSAMRRHEGWIPGTVTIVPRQP